MKWIETTEYLASYCSLYGWNKVIFSSLDANWSWELESVNSKEPHKKYYK